MNNEDKTPENRIRDLILQYCKEQGLEQTYYALKRETNILTENDNSFDEPDDSEDRYALRIAVDLFDAMKAAEKSMPVRRFDEYIRQLLTKGETKYRTEAKQPVKIRRQDTHNYLHKSNILVVASHPTIPHVVATTAADKYICISNLRTRQVLCRVSPTDDRRMPSVALSLDFNPANPELLLVSYINGTISLFRVPTAYLTGSSAAGEDLNEDGTRNIPEAELLQTWKMHEKFAIAAQFTLDGFGFISGAHDNKVAIFKTQMQSTTGDEKALPKYECVKEIVFNGQVEALTRLHPKNGSATDTPEGKDDADVLDLPPRTFVLSVRGENNLLFLDLDTADVVGQMNMNANGDDHVSFTALSLACSPRGHLLLVATDTHRVIMFHIPTRSIVRNFYGATNGDMSSPRVCWAPRGDMTRILCTAQDNSIHVWDANSQRHLGVSHENHSKRLRDFTCSATGDGLYSVSFDQTLIEWQIVEE